jgi:hypothetical protein
MPKLMRSSQYADAHRFHVGGGFLGRSAELFDQIGRPAHVFRPAGAGMIVRGADHDVGGRHAGLFFDLRIAPARTMSSHAPMVSIVTMAAFVSPSSKIEHARRGADRARRSPRVMCPTTMTARSIRRRDVDLRDAGFQVRGAGSTAACCNCLTVFDRCQRPPPRCDASSSDQLWNGATIADDVNGRPLRSSMVTLV